MCVYLGATQNTVARAQFLKEKLVKATQGDALSLSRARTHTHSSEKAREVAVAGRDVAVAGRV